MLSKKTITSIMSLMLFISACKPNYALVNENFPVFKESKYRKMLHISLQELNTKRAFVKIGEILPQIEIDFVPTYYPHIKIKNREVEIPDFSLFSETIPEIDLEDYFENDIGEEILEPRNLNDFQSELELLFMKIRNYMNDLILFVFIGLGSLLFLWSGKLLNSGK